jgi:glycosyltransferase involved in cell wall biosynthesis
VFTALIYNRAFVNGPMAGGLVTTIIPVYNRPAMLAEAVASVLAQTYRPIEIIIVDDGSTDETPRAIAALADAHPEIRALRIPNGGPGAAREAARRMARGEFIQHLDSDDLIDTRKFELQVAALRAHPECGVSYCKARLVAPDGTIDTMPSRRTGERIDTMFPAMLQSRWWETAAPLYRASLIDQAGPWLPLRAEEDWELDCRIAARGVRVCFVDEWLCSHRRHEENISGHVDERTLRDRATAHAAILRHARSAGIGDDAPEMRHFARELFLLARQCGSLGLNDEAAVMFRLARDASGPRRDALQFRLYAALVSIAGWPAAGKLSAALDRLR